MSLSAEFDTAADRRHNREESVKKLATYVLIALIVWWVIQDPASAARLVHGIGGFLAHAAHSRSTLTSGTT